MKNRRHFFSLLVAATLSLTFNTSMSLADDGSVSAALSKMEMRLLDHDYPKETTDARLARLEKFVFGGPETGTSQVRVDRLKAAIVPDSNQTAPVAQGNQSSQSDKSKSKATQTATSKNASNGSNANASKNQTASSTAKTYDPSDYGNYPRVAELESTLLGKTFDSDPLPVRLARLETKEYGKPSTEDDLGDRIDKLDQLVLRTNPVGARVAQAPGISPSGISPYGYGDTDQCCDAPVKPVAENPFISGAPKINSVEQRTSTLEKFVFGHEHFGKPLAERVQKLEKKLIPYEHQADKDIATRVDHLWTLLSAANTMNTSPISTD